MESNHLHKESGRGCKHEGGRWSFEVGGTFPTPPWQAAPQNRAALAAWMAAVAEVEGAAVAVAAVIVAVVVAVVVAAVVSSSMTLPSFGKHVVVCASHFQNKTSSQLSIQ